MYLFSSIFALFLMESVQKKKEKSAAILLLKNTVQWHIHDAEKSVYLAQSKEL